jgi:hypothetical protein
MKNIRFQATERAIVIAFLPAAQATRPTGNPRALGLALAAMMLLPGVAAAAPWRAGVARENITPPEFMWMSGYASRNHPADGKLTDLWAKALVLEDASGKRVALVTLDLVGIDRDLSRAVCSGIESRTGLTRAQIALNCSHTHTGPVVGRNLRAMYFLDDAQLARATAYTDRLEKQVVEVVARAIENLQPADVTFGAGQATFAVNRRNNPEAEVPKLREQGALRGPVDHEVPVLAVRSPEGVLRAVAFDYACHATVLDAYQWSGDYPGFAQIELEKKHPDLVALFVAGCGADQNPLPRRTPELAQTYGARLAQAVEDVLAAPMQPLSGEIAAVYREIPLALDTLPTREELEQQTRSDNKYVVSRAKLLLAQLDQTGSLASDYPYPISTWRLGDGPLWVFLGGEVVVDYALRLKRELATLSVWPAGYSHDVMAYIPSLRVLKEGGYEGGGAMVYYGLPTVWSPQVEESIVAEVRRQAGELK